MKKLLFTLLLPLAAMAAQAQNRDTHYQQIAASSKAALYAFPNPARDYVTVQMPYVMRLPVDVLVMDYNGNVLRNFRFAAGAASYSLDISYLDRGMYLLRIHEGNALAGIIKLSKDR